MDFSFNADPTTARIIFAFAAVLVYLLARRWPRQ